MSAPIVEPNVVPAPAAVQDLAVVCGWCRAVLHAGAPGAQETTGICEPCRAKWNERRSALRVERRGRA